VLVARTVAYVRTVRTSSGATPVQVVWSSRRGSRQIEHPGSAHSRGITNNDQWLQHRMAALNLRRMITLGLARQEGVWALS
jgi:hypothetical protein